MNDALKHELLQIARRIVAKAESEMEFIDDIEINSNQDTTYIRIGYRDGASYAPVTRSESWSEHIDNANGGTGKYGQ